MKVFFTNLMSFVGRYLSIPDIGITDVVEILIISFIIYELMLWIKNTRAWMLFKGIVFLLIFVGIAALFNMNTILWIAYKTFNVGVIAVIVVFQPELRRALEQLGRNNIINSFINIDEARINEKVISEKTANEIVKAAFEMGKKKTGALIVIENEVGLSEYERTGIELDAEVSSQLLINIFEHNTPLHDGAVIIKGNRITSATCYLPLSDNMELSKELGTRHRAAVGISEVTDSLTIIVSEETGSVSTAMMGRISRNLDADEVKNKIKDLKMTETEETSSKFKVWKGRKRSK